MPRSGIETCSPELRACAITRLPQDQRTGSCHVMSKPPSATSLGRDQPPRLRRSRIAVSCRYVSYEDHSWAVAIGPCRHMLDLKRRRRRTIGALLHALNLWPQVRPIHGSPLACQVSVSNRQTAISALGLRMMGNAAHPAATSREIVLRGEAGPRPAPKAQATAGAFSTRAGGGLLEFAHARKSRRRAPDPIGRACWSRSTSPHRRGDAPMRTVRSPLLRADAH